MIKEGLIPNGYITYSHYLLAYELLRFRNKNSIISFSYRFVDEFQDTNIALNFWEIIAMKQNHFNEIRYKEFMVLLVLYQYNDLAKKNIT